MRPGACGCVRLSVWAALGGGLALAGLVLVLYYAFVVYMPITCNGEVPCPAIAPLAIEGWLGLAFLVALVGLGILLATLVHWLVLRRRDRGDGGTLE